MICHAFIALAAAIFAALVTADPISGQATFTEGSVSGGTCSFTNYSLPTGIYGAGLGPANWANGSKCGACLQVEGPQGSVNVMV